jgi:hypothetical protein
MSYSTDPVQDAARYYSALYSADEAQAMAEAQATHEFLAACKKCDANAIAGFAGLTTDWDFPIGLHSVGTPRPKRSQPLHEVMADALDDSLRSELMQLVLNVAHGSDLVNTPAQARALLERVAAAWASEFIVVEG